MTADAVRGAQVTEDTVQGARLTAPRVAMLEAFGVEMQALVAGIVGDQLDLVYPASNATPDRAAVLADAQYAIVRSIRMQDELLDAAPHLKLIHQWGTGMDGLPVAAAAQRGIIVARSPGRNAISVADHTIGLMLDCLKRISIGDRRIRDGLWLEPGIYAKGKDLTGACVGLVGYGATGREVAKRLRGFDCEVLYTRASGPLDDVPGYATLDTLLHRADVVSLHLPLNAGTHHLIDAGAIGKMRKGAILINLARGSIIDQGALLEALHSGRLGGAGLDVFEPEPLPLDHPLRQAPTAVLTPHMAGGTRENLARIVSHWAGNILRHANGQGLEEADLVR